MQQRDALIRVIKSNDYIVGLRKDGVVHVYFRPCTTITVPLQLELVGVYHKITEGKKAKFIFEADEFVTITREARDSGLVYEDIVPIAATAIVAKNWMHRLIAGFYSKIQRPKNPYKVVSSFNKGIEWLHQISTEHVVQ